MRMPVLWKAVFALNAARSYQIMTNLY
jgi:hypothetical protein